MVRAMPDETFLGTVRKLGGQAGQKDIADALGLKATQIRYRLDDLARRGQLAKRNAERVLLGEGGREISRDNSGPVLYILPGGADGADLLLDHDITASRGHSARCYYYHSAMATLNIVSGPDWATIMTAFGTVGAVIAAVWIAIASSRKTDKAVAAERTEADQRLREQLDHSADLLRKQQEHSDQQLLKQQEHSDHQLAEEREAAEERLRQQFAREEQVEQRGEAAAVSVTSFVMPPEDTVTSPPEDPVGRPAIIVANKGRYAIENVDARLSPDGTSTVPFVMRRNLSRVDEMAEARLFSLDVISPLAEVYLGAIAPDARMLFIGDHRLVRDLRTYFPIIRWTDRWGDAWENRRGFVYQTHLQADWLAGSGPPP